MLRYKQKISWYPTKAVGLNDLVAPDFNPVGLNDLVAPDFNPVGLNDPVAADFNPVGLGQGKINSRAYDQFEIGLGKQVNQEVEILLLF